MKYEKTVTAKFISRPNRFVAQVLLNGEEASVHVKNTGRCRELLVPGSVVYLENFSYRQGKRKLLYDLVAVRKGDLLINMDSQAPNKVVMEALENGSIKLPGMSDFTVIRPEKVYGDSRFDFYIEDKNGEKGFVEVKGVTLENNGIASFPDAPTERGVKHIKELVSAMENGYHSYVLFVIQMSEIKMFTPNDATHMKFGDALRCAAEKGVHILAYECAVTPDSLEITKAVPIELNA
ncbi:MAG: DNA/RNA nuclease SfsA [Alistipes sp.]|nr:DNA/RNA nuclease SfsA [Alistipes sp.]